MKKNVFSLLMLIGALFPCLSFANDFVLGADVSWTTEFEAQGRKFFDYQGNETETFALMKKMGLSAVRLRVWVNPVKHNNWCNKEDVLTKALRAKAQDLDIMIDFHYSDWWADPGKQDIPETWAKHKYKQMLKDVTCHTTEVLQLLKDNGVTPKWVQVGNETSKGMLWPMGQLETNPKQYAGLFSAGYNAVKSVFPETKVIVHLDNGFDDHLYNRNLDLLRDNGAKWDIIGMSIYPYWAKKAELENTTERLYYDMKRNIKSVVKKYGTDVMIVETGFEVDEQNPWKMEIGREQLSQLIHICRDETDGHCLGVFYWEPTAIPSQYKLGAFTEDGHPTSIMRAFTVNSLQFITNNPQPSSFNLQTKYDRHIMKMETTMGDIVFELYNETPKHRDNMLHLAERHALDSLLFHRVIKNFMIQCGDPKSKYAYATTTEDPADALGEDDVLSDDGQKYKVPAEIVYPKFFHKRGAVAAAREGDKDNPEKASSSSQIYFVWGDWPVARRPDRETQPILPYYEENKEAGTPWLDGSYTVFGEIIDGLDTVKKIQALRRDVNDRPVDDVRVIKLYEVK